MKKSEEIKEANSCWNKAKDDELMFVILERDKAAPATIRKWIDERIRLGLNKPTDIQITSTEQLIKDLGKKERAVFCHDQLVAMVEKLLVECREHDRSASHTTKDEMYHRAEAVLKVAKNEV